MNGRSYKILKLVGEGGFSFIYLVEDITSARVFALKKIRCPLGSESVRTALKEVEAYKRFRHPSIIRCLDSCVVQEGEGKIIYLFLPYYKNGTIQHIINTNAVNGSKYDEKAMLSIFLGTCDAVRAMHHYVAGPTAAYPPVPTSASSPSDVDRSGGIRLQDEDEEEDDDDGPIMTGGEGEALIGGLSGAAEEEAAEEGASAEPVASGSRIATDQKVQPWAHRDIKPVSIMPHRCAHMLDELMLTDMIGQHHDRRRWKDANSHGFRFDTARTNSCSHSLSRSRTARFSS